MKIKVLTHIIRLSDGHVMPSWEYTESETEAKEISRKLRACELDSDGYAIRIRRSPKSRHQIDVTLEDGAWGYW
tara:strand:+ start:52 stop:273 length:222 start_codon:yes stop_codon:yes gene_type:complete